MNTSGYTPADLQNMGFFLDALRALQPATLTASENLPAAQPVPESIGTLTSLESPEESFPVEPNLNDIHAEAAVKVSDSLEPNVLVVAIKAPVNHLCVLSASVVNPNFRRRGKVARLPDTVRDNLNALLQSGASYSYVIAWLNAQSYTGFNKVNLHNWRKGGFQDWLREHCNSDLRDKPSTALPRSTSSRPEVH